MNKSEIKIRLKEALDELFTINEAKKVKSQKDQDSDEKDKEAGETGEKKSGKKDYTDVRRAFEKLGGPSMVDVMKLTGIKDDEKGVNRSLFRKKVKQIKNKDTGSYYQFDDEELNQVRAALDIKK
jgi:hypothetical protein